MKPPGHNSSLLDISSLVRINIDNFRPWYPANTLVVEILAESVLIEAVQIMGLAFLFGSSSHCLRG